MSMKLILSAIVIVTTTTTVFAGSDDNLSAYQAIEQYGFPPGILPIGVTGYELNRETGEFEAHWAGSCKFSLQGSYSLRYKPTVTGVVSDRRLSSLKGVSVKVLFFWLDIVEVVRDGDDLRFSVGITSASFPVDGFLESPRCGCGFDCPDDDLDSGRVASY